MIIYHNLTKRLEAGHKEDRPPPGSSAAGESRKMEIPGGAMPGGSLW